MNVTSFYSAVHAEVATAFDLAAEAAVGSGSFLSNHKKKMFSLFLSWHKRKQTQSLEMGKKDNKNVSWQILNAVQHSVKVIKSTQVSI